MVVIVREILYFREIPGSEILFHLARHCALDLPMKQVPIHQNQDTNLSSGARGPPCNRVTLSRS